MYTIKTTNLKLAKLHAIHFKIETKTTLLEEL